MGREPVWIGIDVSTKKLDVAVRPSGEFWSSANNEKGILEVLDKLKPLSSKMIVVEATGGLEVSLVSSLASAKLPVVAVNPRQVRDFSKATGTLAKTDKIDAHVIAHFGEAVQPEIRPVKDEILLGACRKLQ